MVAIINIRMMDASRADRGLALAATVALQIFTFAIDFNAYRPWPSDEQQRYHEEICPRGVSYCADQ
ncbi:hypothetical protein HYPP_02695 [Hyphomicrobium sp. ghe19]|nr:hypothetical protein HYPP_02695 [Hyphomicrobium sp. ghe19]